MAQGKSPRLPNAYQEVEYIESTGTQYIDLGYLLLMYGDVEVYCKIAWTEFSALNSGQYTAFLGYNGNMQLAQAPSSQNVGCACIGNAINQNVQYTLNQITEVNANLSSTLANVYYKIDGVDTGLARVSNTNSTVLLFSSLNPQYNAKLKLYELILSHDNTPINHLIPCYRRSDNEICLYDIVQGGIWVNQGTGTFLKGNDV